ncbi:MAG: extracellular solute-binding protein [Beijerinckiaceae bacterium]|jgi:ABC-type Fe3+ transport system substrate-binding protein|nr:extracellular solute-binding protein [Beijerinckiaceae bacterium]
MSAKFILAAFALAIAATSSHAQTADKAMIDAARKEGEITWYTTQIVNQLVRPATAAFEKKYGIKVNYVRANATEIALRVINEARAGRIQADIVDGTATSVMLRREGHIMQWVPQTKFEKQFVDPDRHWIATNLYVLTPGFNTDLVRKGTEPKTYADLLDPKWKGKMIWNSTPSSSAGPGFVGTILNVMGEEKGMAYLRELAKQNVASVASSGRQVLDQVISGEYPIALQIFNNHSVISSSKGAPVSWIPMEPSMAVLSVMSVIKSTPRPNAAKLFVEFITSEEGQKLVQAAGELPVHPDVAPTEASLRPDGVRFKALYLSPEEVEKGMQSWSKTFSEIFR